jgi:hypothetical protein
MTKNNPSDLAQLSPDDAKLAAKIVIAMKEYDAADATRKEKALVAGKLLVEAKKRHPTEKAFEKFLELAGGIQIRRARDLIALALGRKHFEHHQIENAAAQQRHRDKLKAEKIEREREKAALPKPDPKPDPKPKPKGKGKPEPEPEPALRNAQPDTAEDFATRGLFNRACEAYALAKWNGPDLIDHQHRCSPRLEKNVIDAVNDAAEAWIDLRKSVLAAAAVATNKKVA